MKNCKEIAWIVIKHGRNLLYGKPHDIGYVITVYPTNLRMTNIALEMILRGEY